MNYKNLVTLLFNLREVCKELKRKNVKFSYSRKDGLISIFDINVHVAKSYVGIFQGKNKILFKDDLMLSNLILEFIKHNNIEIECKGDRTSIFNIHILLTKDRIITMQNGKFINNK